MNLARWHRALQQAPSQTPVQDGLGPDSGGRGRGVGGGRGSDPLPGGHGRGGARSAGARRRWQEPCRL